MTPAARRSRCRTRPAPARVSRRRVCAAAARVRAGAKARRSPPARRAFAGSAAPRSAGLAEQDVDPGHRRWPLSDW